MSAVLTLNAMEMSAELTLNHNGRERPQRRNTIAHLAGARGRDGVTPAFPAA